jgi:3-oxoacyl-[acyl-carrier protein] reductase
VADIDDVHDRMALVTGGSSGIGRAVALRLWLSGMRVIATYHSGAAAVADIERETAGSPHPIRFIRSDLSTADGAAGLLDQVREVGEPDALVHCAGASRRIALEDLTHDDWNRAFTLHAWSGFALAQGLAPAMRGRRWGRIVFVTSAAVFTGGTLGAHYTASKAAQIGLAHNLARVLGPDSITVNAIAPSGIPTAITTPSGIETHLAAALIPRPGTPDEAADVVDMLMRNGYVTGQTIRVDGGIRLD